MKHTLTLLTTLLLAPLAALHAADEPLKAHTQWAKSLKIEGSRIS